MKINIPNERELASDLNAGLITAISNIPDAMASAILAGANPVHGLYALMTGTSVGAILTSSRFMTVCTTSAMALTVGSALSNFSGESYTSALFSLTILIGIIQVVSGLLKLGHFARFVSNAVMIGFLSGISVLIVISQLGSLTGFSSEFDQTLARAADLFMNLHQVDAHTLAIGTLALLLISFFDRTKLRNFSLLLATILPSAAALIFQWNEVITVADIGGVPQSLPSFMLPDISLMPGLIIPALAVSLIGLVQGAGISKAYPNPDGSYPDISRDFVGQGGANIAAGFFQGMPLGGSLAATILNLNSGAKSRLSNLVFSPIIILSVLLFREEVGLVAVPTLAAILIAAGVQSLRRERIMEVWNIGMGSRVVMLSTFVLTISLPIIWAIFVGVVLSGIVHFSNIADGIKIIKIVPKKDGTYEQEGPPHELPSNSITLLDIHGSLLYAGSDKLKSLLPSAEKSYNSVVILRLYRQNIVCRGFIVVLESYGEQIKSNGGRLMLAWISHSGKKQGNSSQTLLSEENIVLAPDLLITSTKDALILAQQWLHENSGSPADTVYP